MLSDYLPFAYAHVSQSFMEGLSLMMMLPSPINMEIRAPVRVRKRGAKKTQALVTLWRVYPSSSSLACRCSLSCLWRFHKVVAMVVCLGWYWEKRVLRPGLEGAVVSFLNKIV